MPADDPPFLRREGVGGRTLAIGLAAAAVTGGLAAWLVLRGNPGNMGICGACFLRDLSGALGLSEKAPAIFRPELAGVLLGAYLWTLSRDRFVARSGSLTRTREMLATDAIIGWNFHSTFFQRRAGLVTLVATTAGGSQSVTALDVPVPDAVACADEAIPGLVSQFLEP